MDKFWDQIAFLGRYGRQPADVCLRMTLRRLHRLTKSIARLMEEESEAVRNANA